MMPGENNKDVTEHRAQTQISGLLMIGLLAVLWGGNWPAMKLAVMEIPPWTFRSICLVTGGFGLLAIARITGKSLHVPRDNLSLLLAISLLNITLWHLLSAYGLAMIGAGRAVIIAFTMPLWAVLLSSLILKDQLTVQRMVALALGLAGLALLIGPDFKTLGATPLGAFLMLAAAFSWALGTVVMKIRNWTMSILVLTGWQLVLGSIPVVLGMLLFELPVDLSGLSTECLLGLAYTVFVATFICHTTWFALVRVLPVAVAALGTLAIPIVGVLFSALILEENFAVRELLSLCLVVLALATVLLVPIVTPPPKISR